MSDPLDDPITPTGLALSSIGVLSPGQAASIEAEAIAIGAKTERERCIEALRREAQDALDSGIRPSGKELDAWNYIARHFRDSAAVILAEPEAER